MTVDVRAALPSHADQMAELINRIITIGGTTAYRAPFDREKIVSEFIAPELAICCHVAIESGKVCGFQALLWADPTWPGEHRLPADWALIATYVDPEAHGKGIGRALFARTAAAARDAGASTIDATIRKENTGGLSYYARMGFVDYRSDDETVSKRYKPV
ncbi:GNAT family N-acetyltransferase [Roseibium sp. MMSF_3412]|uniref:GNAT family N-acetyltransferase n=1 Tax=Roseibium sp. MMSF_3412 TaxID=3046712 RepID=UPI00273E858E|nr:GNAT family N-acetyltransferase [Roseibium sp. MMSF_3412]